MICVFCDKAIKGKAVEASAGDSMSGARPPAYAHPKGSPECKRRPYVRTHQLRSS